MKQFSLICAVSNNGIIGDSATNTMPWHIPSDLKYFRSKTLNKTVVMGSRTFDSIGKPLKDRRNVVITRNLGGEVNTLFAAGVDESYRSFSDAHKVEREGFFVVGGQHIYQDALRLVPNRLFITIVNMDVEGDVRFPISGSRFKEDYVLTQSGQRYVCEKRSGWMTENGVEFQFTEFVHRPQGAY